MGKKVLVAYASKLGATAEIAEKISEVLNQNGLDVDLKPVKEVGSLEDYQAVVLGSAVYYGQWRKDAVSFLKNNEVGLGEKETWFFSSGPTGEGDPVEMLEGWSFPSPQQEIADRIKPIDIAVFHGFLDESKLNFFERWVLNKIGSPAGDFRDWDMITAWAGNVARKLTN